MRSFQVEVRFRNKQTSVFPRVQRKCCKLAQIIRFNVITGESSTSDQTSNTNSDQNMFTWFMPRILISSVRKSIFNSKYNVHLYKWFLYKNKVFTYNHGKFSIIPIQARITNIEQKSSNAVQEDKDCKGNIKLCRRRVISNKDIAFPIYITHVYIWMCLKWCFVQPIKKRLK